VDAWKSSPIYKLWVIGGLIAIVAFAVIGGLSDPTDQSLIFWLIPMLAVYMGVIFFLQYRQVDRAVEADTELNEPSAGLVRWNIVFGAILCAAIFTGVAAFYADVGGTLYPFGDTGPGFPVVLLPAIMLALIGAARSMSVLRDIRRGAYGDGGSDPELPTDIPDRSRSSKPSR
jgi:uncharacterized membrane protein YfcA